MECYLVAFAVHKDSDEAVLTNRSFRQDNRTACGLNTRERCAQIFTAVQIYQSSLRAGHLAVAVRKRTAHTVFTGREERHIGPGKFHHLERSAQNLIVEFNRTVHIGCGQFEPVNRI